MSIGLFTFHRQLNYGGVLQALALHDTLEEISGTRVETIDMWMDPRDQHLWGKETNRNVPFFSRLRNRLKAQRKYPIGRKEFEFRRLKTYQLIKERLNLSETQYRSAKELRNLPAYKTVVVGSDQLWNYDLVRAFKENPWLCKYFPQTQDRVTYAMSFGITSLPEEMLPTYREGISAFRAITLREASGFELLEKILGEKTKALCHVDRAVLDPTLLRTCEQWEKEIASRPYPQDEYILAYWLTDATEEVIQWLREVSRKQGKKVLLLVAKPVQWLPEKEDWLSVRFDADPLDFVTLIAHASGILTDSFHGLQIATIFRRKITVFTTKNRNTFAASSRFFDFCQRYGASTACREHKQIFESTDVEFCDLAQLNYDLLESDRLYARSVLKSLLPE